MEETVTFMVDDPFSGLGLRPVELTDRGRLVVVKPGGKEYEPVAEYKVSDRPTWPHPVFLGDRILVKDDTTLRSLRIEPDGK